MLRRRSSNTILVIFIQQSKSFLHFYPKEKHSYLFFLLVGLLLVAHGLTTMLTKKYQYQHHPTGTGRMMGVPYSSYHQHKK
jgi:hypothetical protein